MNVTSFQPLYQTLNVRIPTVAANVEPVFGKLLFVLVISGHHRVVEIDVFELFGLFILSGVANHLSLPFQFNL